ncbi:MAG TPA: hypothetical protein HA362_02815 [Nanoarchaeota archaeon]|nr:hypothetical protein [Nanoarchaeota archaeon]
MRIEAHEKRLNESINVIEESIEIGIEERQRNIGFNASAAAIDMLEILLHKAGRISTSQVIKHQWLASANKIREKLWFDFPRKQELMKLITAIESRRNKLCYGTPQPLREIEGVINDFNRLRQEFRRAMGEVG